jgi:hypothetical protein
MKALVAALAIAALITAPALAKSAAHHPRGQHLYLQASPSETGPADQAAPAGVMVRGFLMTDPDPQIRAQLHRGYQSGSTD